MFITQYPVQEQVQNKNIHLYKTYREGREQRVAEVNPLGALRELSVVATAEKEEGREQRVAEYPLGTLREPSVVATAGRKKEEGEGR